MKKTTAADVERDLLAVLNNTKCRGCGCRIMRGDSYCRPCGEAVNRLVARGVLYNYRPEVEWSGMVAKERAAHEHPGN